MFMLNKYQYISISLVNKNQYISIVNTNMFIRLVNTNNYVYIRKLVIVFQFKFVWDSLMRIIFLNILIQSSNSNYISNELNFEKLKLLKRNPRR